MEKLLTIINPNGSFRGKKKKIHKLGVKTMKKKRVSRRRKRKNPVKHRPVVYAKRKTGKKRGFYRPKKSRLPVKINKRRRIRSRRNPSFKNFKVRQYFGRNRLLRGLTLIGGIGAGAFGKSILAGMVPNVITTRFGSLGLLMLGAMVNQKGRRVAVKNIGTGIVAFSIYDLLVQNIPMLSVYLPTIGAPTFKSSVSGNVSYGRSTYGSQLPRSNAEVVGAFYSPEPPETVGEDMDLADALEMAA